ncbi:DUF3515 domain-containing protein [Blastococcus sp. SYSU D00820]
MPVLVALVVLVRLTDGDEPAGDGAVAEIDGSAGAEREDLPTLPVEVPPVTPEADANCPALMTDLPLDLLDEPSRRVQSETPYAYAWGDPPIVLVCGVDRPAGYVVGAFALEVNGVTWYVDDSDPDQVVWTTVDRPVYVELTLPGGSDSAPAAALSGIVAANLPYQEPQPGPA